MEVKKTFVADGKKYRPGDAAPEMDKTTADHYLRLGMIGQAKEAKPSQNKAAGPKETK